MKSNLLRSAPLFSFSVLAGTLVTLSLLLAINLLAHYRTYSIEQRPLLVLDLMVWPAPNNRSQQEQLPKQMPSPALKQPEAKKTLSAPVPKAAPAVKKVVKETVLETVEHALPEEVEDVDETVVSVPSRPTQLTSAKPTKNTLPTPVPIFQVTQVPRFLHRETPVYPEAMRVQGVIGVVKLEALIDQYGRVRQINILKSAGELFDEAAKHAVWASSFYPAEIDGKPVAVRLRLPVKFELY